MMATVRYAHFPASGLHRSILPPDAHLTAACLSPQVSMSSFTSLFSFGVPSAQQSILTRYTRTKQFVNVLALGRWFR